MRVHVLATRVQFWRHLRPIVGELDEDLIGDVLTGDAAKHPKVSRYDRDDVFLIAASGSIPACKDRRIVYVEHGAGQSYLGVRSRHRQSYAGGPHPQNVIGYVCPSQRVAGMWDRPAIAVGCPALDGITPNGRAVVFTFHWDAWSVCPEARSARPHYLDHLHELVAWVRDTSIGCYPLGHWHPRDRRAEGIWRSLGVETEPDPDEALRRARLVIADNTSFAYEAALLGIPTVALNAPWYRRNVHHGLRFWDHPPGPMVDDADQLMARAVVDWIADDETLRIGWWAARHAYSHPPNSDGGKRAARFITDLVT